MARNYHLAVVQMGQNSHVVVESGGRLLPLHEVLGGVVLERLGRHLGDLSPLLADWAMWDERIAMAVEEKSAAFAGGQAAMEATFAAPIAAPGTIVCIGANYHDHIAEMGIPMKPLFPYSFLKPANNTLRATWEPVKKPDTVEMMDWEAELGVVIGQRCRDVDIQSALSVVAGYTNFNDLSARDWLASRPAIGVDWVQHKAFDGFAPMGPYLLPARFVANPQNLPVRLTVNGIVKQDSNTQQMVFGVAEIIAHLTSIMTLFPGDVIATGTPAGVGQGQKPPQFLQSGDEVRMQIGELGELVTPIS